MTSHLRSISLNSLAYVLVCSHFLWPQSPLEKLPSNLQPSEYPKQAKSILEEAKIQFEKITDKAHPEQNFIETLVLGEWLSLYSPDYEVFKNPDKAKAFTTLLQTKVPYLFLTYLDPKDQIPEALDILCELQIHNPEGVKEYPALAVAFALVHDSPFPEDWPHHQVSPPDLPKGDYSVKSHFDFLVESQANNKLLQDISALDVSQLKFIIDLKLPLTELVWAQKNIRNSRSQFDDVYTDIRYDQDRIKISAHTWPNGPYTLAAIQSKGGICVDQAYFASISGKAKGLPTLYFSGQGTHGGHAWFGFLRTQEKWELNAGRYSNQNYCVGFARDPQTWEKINDSHLKQLADKVEDNPDYIPLRFLFNWLKKNPSIPSFASTLESLKEAIPNYAPFWRACSEKIIMDQKSDEEKVAFWEKWIAQFSNSPDLKVEGQEELSKLCEKLGKTSDAEELKRQIISQNKRKRFDIGIEAEAQEMCDLLNQKKYDEAEVLYKKLIQNYDDKAGGMLFYKVIVPYVSILADAKEFTPAINGYKYAAKHLNPTPDSIVGKSLAQLKTTLEVKSGSRIR